MKRRRGLTNYRSSRAFEIYKNYFTIKALEDDLTLTHSKGYIQYCIDGSDAWIRLAPNTESLPIKAGHKISVKASGITPTAEEGMGTMFMSKKCDISGNIYSLVYGDRAKESTINNVSYVFCKLFQNNTNIINADKIILPSVFAGKYAYAYMFDGCTSLESVPTISATTFSEGSCYAMFRDCASIENPPVLDGPYLADSVYALMFKGCTSLKTIPSLSSWDIKYSCYESMFEGCTSIENSSSLNLNNTATNCFKAMFKGCTSLKNAPTLSSTYLYSSCYESMFEGCSSLETAPALPAKSLSNYCYASMFKGCALLESAPDLLASGLSSYCYDSMFEGCSSLNYIKATFTTTPGPNYTNNWVNGVSAEGRFVKNYKATWESTGVNSIPEGWEVIETINDNDYLSVYDSTNAFKYIFTKDTEYYVDGTGWVILAANTWSQEFAKNTHISIRSNLADDITNDNGCGRFTFSGTSINVYGTPLSLLYYDSSADHTTIPDYAFLKLFYGCTNVKSVSSNFLSDITSFGNSSFSYMFYQTAITSSPDLPVTELAENCYSYMFSECASLKTAPTLPAITLVENCYSNMFKGCTNLNYVKALFRTDPTTISATDNWLLGVSETGKFVKSGNATWESTGVNSIPEGWTIEYTPYEEEEEVAEDPTEANT